MAPPNAKPVTVMEPIALPAGIVTVGGSTSRLPAGVDDNVTTTPPVGAGALRTMLPLVERVGLPRLRWL